MFSWRISLFLVKINRKVFALFITRDTQEILIHISSTNPPHISNIYKQTTDYVAREPLNKQGQPCFNRKVLKRIHAC